jgi:GNAT superfamily N-acetyltransferase
VPSAITDATMEAGTRLGALEQKHRERLREILDATAVFRPEEVEVALELFDEAFENRGIASGTHDTFGPSRSASSEAAASDYEFVGAFDGSGGLAGFACYGPTPGTDRTYDLYWIAVDPRRHGQGDGSRLLAEVERQLDARSARLLVVETSSRDLYQPTRRFYESRRYACVARVRDFYAPADDRVVYTKRMGVGSGQ